MRAEQMERTRVRIFEAVTRLLGEEAMSELTIPKVARAARVSVRTVYRHFPTKDALLDEFAAWIDGELGSGPLPATAEAVPDYTARLYRSFDEHQPLIRAALLTRGGRELQRAVRARGRQPRYRALEDAVEPELAGLDPTERRRVLAVLFLLHSAPAWQALRDFWNLDGNDAAEAVSWAVAALVDDLNRRAAPEGA